MKDPNASPMSKGSARALEPARMEEAAAIPRPIGAKSSARALTMTLQSGNYRFTVQASNKAGSGPQSARSNLVVAQ